MTDPSDAVPQPSSAGDADVLVVGAGPAGSATAYWLAQAGLDVLVLEKSRFPREKVCGDGLTPRATRQLVRMGVDTSVEAGWLHNLGLRVNAGGHSLLLPWPELSSYPSYGLVRARSDFDLMLARHATSAGARLVEGTAVGGPVLDAAGRVVGVEAQQTDPDGEKRDVTYRAKLVVAADGVSSRIALALGLERRENRPLGVAVRSYYEAPERTNDEWLESWLQLADSENPDALLPGYGWIFGMGDGTSNVGVGILNSSKEFGRVDYRSLLKRWIASLPEESGLSEQRRTAPVRGAALPMGFNRKPHYTRGLLLVGDSGGMVNPFNGEGIAYAMEAAEIAADAITQALARPEGPSRELALAAYPQVLRERLGGYYTLGRVFVKLISNPRVMRLCTERGLTHPHLMKFTLKLLANLTDPRDGDVYDRTINALTRMAPAA